MVELALHVCNPAMLRRLTERRLQTGIDGLGELSELNELEVRASTPVAPALRGLPFSRLYLGNEFCPHLAWNCAELKRGIETAGRHGLSVTVALSPQSERGVERTLADLSLATGGRPDLVEIAAGDWGSARVAARAGYAVEAGRLLYKAKRLPRLSRETLPADLAPGTGAEVLECQLGELACFPADTPWGREWLATLGVRRVAVDPVPQGLKLAPEASLPISLHLPFSHVTGGGECPVASLRSTSSGEVRCRRDCRRSWIASTFGYRTWPLVQVGQTVFAAMGSLLPAYLALPRVERVVVSAGFPM